MTNKSYKEKIRDLIYLTAIDKDKTVPEVVYNLNKYFNRLNFELAGSWSRMIDLNHVFIYIDKNGNLEITEGVLSDSDYLKSEEDVSDKKILPDGAAKAIWSMIGVLVLGVVPTISGYLYGDGDGNENDHDIDDWDFKFDNELIELIEQFNIDVDDIVPDRHFSRYPEDLNHYGEDEYERFMLYTESIFSHINQRNYKDIFSEKDPTGKAKFFNYKIEELLNLLQWAYEYNVTFLYGDYTIENKSMHIKKHEEGVNILFKKYDMAGTKLCDMEYLFSALNYVRNNYDNIDDEKEVVLKFESFVKGLANQPWFYVDPKIKDMAGGDSYRSFILSEFFNKKYLEENDFINLSFYEKMLSDEDIKVVYEEIDEYFIVDTENKKIIINPNVIDSNDNFDELKITTPIIVGYNRLLNYSKIKDNNQADAHLMKFELYDDKDALQNLFEQEMSEIQNIYIDQNIELLLQISPFFKEIYDKAIIENNALFFDPYEQNAAAAGYFDARKGIGGHVVICTDDQNDIPDHSDALGTIVHELSHANDLYYLRKADVISPVADFMISTATEVKAFINTIRCLYPLIKAYGNIDNYFQWDKFIAEKYIEVLEENMAKGMGYKQADIIASQTVSKLYLNYELNEKLVYYDVRHLHNAGFESEEGQKEDLFDITSKEDYDKIESMVKEIGEGLFDKKTIEQILTLSYLQEGMLRRLINKEVEYQKRYINSVLFGDRAYVGPDIEREILEFFNQEEKESGITGRF
jgi:Txe/YoeB family toxin of Txe-Axe toxin-antitoxin module